MAFTRKEEDEDSKEQIPMFMRSTPELKEFVSKFENQIKENKDGFPKNPLHPEIKKRNLLPDCGDVQILSDRGVIMWYLENGWLDTWPPEKDQPRRWAVTMKYVRDGVAEKEAALDELNSRRRYAREKERESVNA